MLCSAIAPFLQWPMTHVDQFEEIVCDLPAGHPDAHECHKWEHLGEIIAWGGAADAAFEQLLAEEEIDRLTREW